MRPAPAEAYSVVITDLDDTLFDWLGLWHSCFSAMLDQVLAISGMERARVLADFRKVHQRHGTAEYAFSLQELECLLEAEGAPAAIEEKYQPAIEAYRAARRARLRLYPTVLETLVALRGLGCLVVGYTDSLAFYAAYRIRRLGLDGILDYLFSPADHDVPDHLPVSALRYYRDDAYGFRHTIHHHTPEGERKPSAKVLLKILADIGADHRAALYVGDKLLDDVLMAKRAGVMDVHAVYGKADHRREYDLLRAVSHWTDEKVRAERSATPEQVLPTHAIKSFGELMERFCFKQFEGGVRRD